MNCIEDLRKSVTNPGAFVEGDAKRPASICPLKRQSGRGKLPFTLVSKTPKWGRSPYCRMVISDAVFSEIEFFGTNGRVTGTV